LIKMTSSDVTSSASSCTTGSESQRARYSITTLISTAPGPPSDEVGFRIGHIFDHGDDFGDFFVHSVDRFGDKPETDLFLACADGGPGAVDISVVIEYPKSSP
jgi:hypothetical protein